MNILVVTDLYPINSEEKTTPRTIQNFVPEWQKLGHNIKIIRPNFLLNSIIRKKTFYKSGIYGDVENINYFLPFVGNIKRKIKGKYSPDIVIAHMPCGLIYANKLGYPFVAGVHVSDIEVLTNPVYSIYFRKQLESAYKNAKKIACRSFVLQTKLLNLYPQYKDKTFVAYSGISENFITKKDFSPKNKFKIITCANLIKRKNIDKLIEACDKIPNVELTVIGDGSEIKKLKKFSSKTIFTGRLQNKDVLEKMRESDIFVLPSKNETFGMVYLEAMASGCIPICLKNEGIDGIIKDSYNGYLCELDNLKSTIEKAIAEYNPQIHWNIYETIKQYTAKKAAEHYLNNLT